MARQDRLDRIREKAASRRARIDERARGREIATGISPQFGRVEDLSSLTSNRVAFWTGEELSHPTSADTKPDASVASPEEWFVHEHSRTPQVVEAVGNCVFSSRIITENPAYLERCCQTNLLYLENDELNAFATDGALEIAGKQIPPPIIAVLDGICNAVRLVALGVAMISSGNPAVLEQGCGGVFRAVSTFVGENGGTVPTREAAALITCLAPGKRLDADSSKMAEILYHGTLFVLIAHELGHICLSHTLGNTASMEVSRAQERQADLFVAAAVATYEFPDRAILGGLTFWILLCWLDGPNVRETGATHPKSVDRLCDYVRDHRKRLERIGCTDAMIRAALPGYVDSRRLSFADVIQTP